MRLYPLLALTCVLCVALRVAAGADVVVARQIAPGVVYTQEQRADLVINVLAVDPGQAGVRVEAAVSGRSITGGTGDVSQGRDTVRSVVQRTGAIAGVNADYFDFNGDPLGLGIANGDMYSEPWSLPRAAFAMDSSGKESLFGVLSYAGVLTADGRQSFGNVLAINRPLSRGNPNDLVVYTQLYGPISGAFPGAAEVIVQGVNLPIQPNKAITGVVQTVLPATSAASNVPDDGIVFAANPAGAGGAFLRSLQPGDQIRFIAAVAPATSLGDAIRIAAMPASASVPSRAAVADRGALLWSTAANAVGGGPRLIQKGRIAIDGEAEGFNDGFVNGPHPRTAVGATASGRILIVAVEGRALASAGVSLSDLANIMLHYGAVNAINLDGGGSTTMAVEGVTVNYPNAGAGERRVADTLLVYANPAAPSPEESCTLIGPAAAVPAGSSRPMTVRRDGASLAGADPRIVWSGPVTNGVGYITQDGVFHALRAGSGIASAIVDGRVLTAPVTVGGGAAAPAVYKIAATLTAAGDPAQSNISIRVVSATGQPGAHLPLQVIVAGGVSGSAALTTDEDGLASTWVKWNGKQGGTVSIMSDNITPVSLAQPAIDPNRDK